MFLLVGCMRHHNPSVHPSFAKSDQVDYRPDGRIERRIEYNADGSVKTTMTWVYDLHGSLNAQRTVTYLSNGGWTDSEITYLPDLPHYSPNRLSSVKSVKTYDPAGKLLSEKHYSSNPGGIFIPVTNSTIHLPLPPSPPR